MSPDMASWIEEAAKKLAALRGKNIHSGNDFFNALDVVMAALQAAAADGVKLTPREETERMEAERNRLWEGDNIEGIWSSEWDAAPDYLDETPPTGA
jgi:hypothetical protein